MGFQEQIIATFIGALSGFIFSIAVFYITEKIRQANYNSNLAKNIQKEADFNVSLLDTIKEEIDELLRKISANDAGHIYTIFKYDQLQKNFLQQALWNGYLYEKLETEDIYKVQEMWSFFMPSSNQFDIGNVELLKSGQMTQADALNRFEYVKKKIIEFKKFNKDLKKKFTNK